MEAIYKLNGRTVETRKWAGGPWSETQQHGSAPTALVAYIAERIPTPQPMRVARLTIDLLRPVPVAPLDITTEVLREGRKIQLCAVHLSANGVEVARAHVLKVRAVNVDLPAAAAVPPIDLPPPPVGKVENAVPNSGNPFMTGMTMKEVKGAFRVPGPAAVWTRAERPIIEGVETTSLMRAVVTSDFCNGLSSVLDFAKWIFINGDLTINLSRMPIGEWILLDAESWIGAEGAGIAFGKLADAKGYFGRAAQSLVIEPR
jgi:Acyl-CoA thioesterase N-terminal domain/Acyl-CoA thioesterase C-terminal domain